MTTEQIITLINALKGSGITLFKWEDLEIRFGEVNSVAQVYTPFVAPLAPVNVNYSESPDSSLSPEEEKEIKHKIEELTSVMKLDDKELIDRMFPLPADEPESVA